MALRVYNTLTRQDEEFVPLGTGKVRLYTCGPTVYDYAHIGNFRTYLWKICFAVTCSIAATRSPRP